MRSFHFMPEKNLEIVHTGFGPLYTYKDDAITKHLKMYGAYQRNDLSMALSFIKSGDIIFDIGAHIGTFSVPFAKKVGERGHVYAFDAFKDNYCVLKKNIKLNHLESLNTSFWAAVSDQKLNYKTQTGFLNNTGSTFLAVNDTNESVEFPSIVLDKYYKKINRNQAVDFIKVDTEGMDYKVLKSCEALINKNKPILFVEICTDFLKRFGHSSMDVQCLLKKYGYHFFINLGPSSSNSDFYLLGKLPNLYQPAGLFNLLAIHPTSNRYPKFYKGIFYTALFFPKHHIKRIIKRIFNIEIYGSFKQDVKNLIRSIRYLLS